MRLTATIATRGAGDGAGRQAAAESVHQHDAQGQGAGRWTRRRRAACCTRCSLPDEAARQPGDDRHAAGGQPDRAGAMQLLVSRRKADVSARPAAQPHHSRRPGGTWRQPRMQHRRPGGPAAGRRGRRRGKGPAAAGGEAHALRLPEDDTQGLDVAFATASEVGPHARRRLHRARRPAGGPGPRPRGLPPAGCSGWSPCRAATPTAG